MPSNSSRDAAAHTAADIGRDAGVLKGLEPVHVTGQGEVDQALAGPLADRDHDLEPVAVLRAPVDQHVLVELATVLAARAGVSLAAPVVSLLMETGNGRDGAYDLLRLQREGRAHLDLDILVSDHGHAVAVRRVADTDRFQQLDHPVANRVPPETGMRAQRLGDLVRSVGVVRKKRIATRPGGAARAKRLDQKTKRGAAKALRRKVTERE